MPRNHHNNEDTYTDKPLGRAGRGFFVALTLCIIAVAGVAASAFSKKLGKSEIPVSPVESPTTTAVTVTVPPTSAASATTTAVITTTATVTTTAVQTNTDEHPLFILPVSNQIVTPYSETPIFSETMKDYRVHKAVDFKAEAMQTVRACASGTVTAVEIHPLWGASLTVEHDSGIVLIYRGVDAVVREGSNIHIGDTIGNIVEIPCERAMGPHLHLEMYKSDRVSDITTILSGQLTPAK